MRTTVIGDKKTFRDGVIHYLLAGVVFSAFIGGSIEFIILFLLRRNALFLFHGIWGMVVESIITWLAVLLTVRLMRRNRTADSFGLALVATGFSLMVALVALPYLEFFSELSRMPTTYLFLKEGLHTCVFYSATIIYASGFTLRGLLKTKTKPQHSVIQ